VGAGGGAVYATELHAFLTAVLHADEWSVSCPGRLSLGDRATGTHWVVVGGWVGPTAGLDSL
jgi:hypothetical protein